MNEQNFTIDKLLGEYKICIPIIQREYILGNSGKDIKRITDTLIDDIINSLENETPINLNIIYGYHDEKKKVFYPIDGQQRLTLLYLLYYYLHIRIDKEMENKFSYEIRSSTTEFFNRLHEKRTEIKDIIMDKGKGKKEISLQSEIKNKPWFEEDWNLDITIQSVLNVLEKIHKKLGNTDVGEYLDRMSKNVHFDICSEKTTDGLAEYNASVAYVTLNSRGKLLKDFENVKALLVKVENILNQKDENELQKETEAERIAYKYDEKYIDIFYNDLKEELQKKPKIESKTFAYKYDEEYIDIFYNDLKEKSDLQKKTEEINDKSMAFLINSYNLISMICRKGDIVKGFGEYWDKILQDSKENPKFLKGYFYFIKKLLSRLYEVPSLLEFESIKHIWALEKKDFFGIRNNSLLNSKDVDMSVIYILSIYRNPSITVEGLKVLEYILKNIHYEQIKQTNFDFAHFLSKEVSDQNIYDYAVELKLSEVKDRLWSNKFYWQNEKYDLKVLILEQIIKFKIIKYMKENEKLEVSYDFFKDLEKRAIQKNPNSSSQLYYLLQISDLWDDGEVTSSKFKEFNSYLELDKKDNNGLFFSNDLTWKKRFGLSAYYDTENKKLFSSQEINEKSSNNLHYWNMDYYFIKDKEIDNEDKKRKLGVLKTAYELLVSNKMHGLENELKDECYDSCWLKYAIDRNYVELFDQEIRYNTKPYILNHVTRESLNFFAYVYILDLIYKKSDKNEELWKYDNKDQDLILYDQRDIYSRTITDPKYIKLAFNDNKSNLIITSKKNILIFEDLKEIKMETENYKDKYIGPKYKEFSRYKLYQNNTIDIEVDEDSVVLLDMEKKKLEKLTFCFQDYRISTYIIQKDIDKIRGYNEKFNKKIDELTSYAQEFYHLGKTINIEAGNEEVKKFELELEKSDFEIQKREYFVKRSIVPMRKCLFKFPYNRRILMDEFKEERGDTLKTIGYPKKDN